MRKLDRFQFPAKLLTEGRILPNSPKHVRGLLAFYEPCDVLVHIERRKKGKSQEQLGYLYGVVYPEIAKHTGHSVEELDLVFKNMFLKNKVLWRGAEMVVTGSKAPLTSNEMAEFITNVIGEAAGLGIEIPAPDKAWSFR